jgi:hypothetical protein
MAALDEGAREALGINGQSTGVRAIVGENSKNFHKAERLYTTKTNAFCNIN